MLIELLRPLSFFASILSLYPIMMSAFFTPGTRWEERLGMALLRVAFAGCVCFASGILYSTPKLEMTPSASEPSEPAELSEPLLATLPVRLFFWSLGTMALLFALSWYLEAFYIPLTDHGCCRP